MASKWGKCRAEGRDHELADFRSQAIYHNGRLVGHREVCRWCNRPVSELMK